MDTLIQVVSRQGTFNVRRSHYRTASAPMLCIGRGHKQAFVENVQGSVPIAVQAETTFWTDKDTLRQGQVGPFVTAASASLGGREETVHLDDLAVSRHDLAFEQVQHPA